MFGSKKNKDSLRPPSAAESESTMAQSAQPSVLQEKRGIPDGEMSPADSLRALPLGAEAIIPKTGDEKASADVSVIPPADTGSEEEYEYPKSWTLAAITLALCLSVFCMALVSSGFSLHCYSYPQLRRKQSIRTDLLTPRT
jgi:hypothetical protein